MGKKKRQTFGKHARERAIEEKRSLKRQRKQAAAVERQAAGDPEQTESIVPSADGE
jgi:ribosomal protein S21